MMSGDTVDDKTGEFVPSSQPATGPLADVPIPQKEDVAEALTAKGVTAKPREKQPHAVPSEFQLHWRIYYADGTAVSSKETTWEQAKSDNIVAIVQAINDEPADVQLGTPYYWKFDDWICRVWDPTLYLRQTGKVKFGRWATHELFNGAWRNALAMIAPTQERYQQMVEGDSIQSGVVCTHKSVGDDEAGIGFALFYDDKTLWTSESGPWEKAPTDGVLCAVYMIVYTGIKNSWAMRRYTYYFWRGHELCNTDDLEVVLKEFPQCKRGATGFVGRSYRSQAEAIAAALRDDLRDVR